ncbi:MAG: DUF4836 family protein [Bacteroidota bacterium]
MKYFKCSSLVFLFGLLLLTSCKNDPEAFGTAAYIPASATSVTGFDIQRMMDKADFESVKDMEFYREMVGKASKQSDVIAAVLKDPTKSGIDLSGKIYMSTDVNKDDPELFTTHILVPLNDANAFGKLISATDIKVEKKNGLNISGANGNGGTMIWDDKLLALSISNNDTVDTEVKTKMLFELSPEQSIASNKNFTSAVEADHDMVTWMSTNTLAGNPAARMALVAIDVDRDALKDNFIHGYGDFENGKMVAHTDFYFNSELDRNILGRFFKDESSADFSKVLPTNDLTFAMKGALNLRGMDKFLSERPQTKEYADLVMNDFAGFERKQILETLSGDVMVAAYAGDENQSENFITALALKNNKKAKAMLQKAVADKKLKEVEPGLYNVVQLGGEDFSIRINKGMGKFLHFEDMLVYSPNEDLLMQIKNGDISLGGKKINNALDHFDNQTMAGWFDFQSLESKVGDLPTNFFKDVRFNMNSKGADFILETSKPEQNSLKTIFEMMEQQYLKENRQSM